MKKLIVFIGLIMISCAAQPKIISEIQKFQEELNMEYKNPKESPLRGDNFTNFNRHPFFPIDLKYRFNAKFTRTENAVPFEIPTSSGKAKPYVEYGKATFILDGKSYTLNVYQNLNLIRQKGYEDYLFLPFHDATNGKETYGGGKYMDLRIPKSDKIILDFNQSYQPFCAYNAFDYSCPIVPVENTLPIRIEAGVKYDDVYFH
ncbi:DUF1684 domain-containing protein [Chryseobacterium koreense]|uniref:DUF1684 domain-containing protein n=1 Tax=Chryseobacterium koreense CCUG 49689 TaxID=1304281 RepID=A0A0J7IY11_9FLAO|nr:DUF1684 domain-containing protein [Chryseobacterium koreense]KMQ70887.1 hypothetical protein ACM44_09670 [Chryseobacterium koreense CCUG 49689]MBB5332465.1 hypothetical protein [Chryseobacterium koreense]